MKKIRVLVADDHRLILEAVRRSLGNAEDIEIVGEVTSGSQVVPFVSRTNPDLVLLDLRLPGVDGLACLDAIRKRHANVKVVILSAYEDEEHVRAAFARGASAYIVKSVNPLDLPSALRQAVEASVYQPQAFVRGASAAPPGGAGLTDREMDMLKAVARGLSNQAIGKEFWVTEQTVKFHLTNVYRKLGVTNRTEATRFAFNHGLVSAVA